MKKNHLLIFVGLISLFSCRKEIDLKIKNKDAIPVLNYIITNSIPEQTYINITKSNFILNSDRQFEGFDNAQIDFFSSGQKTGLVTNIVSGVELTKGNYFLFKDSNLNRFDFEAKKNYQMKVNIPGYQELSAETYLPSETKFTLANLMSDSNSFEFKIDINDDDPEFNYYLFAVTTEYTNPFDTSQKNFFRNFIIPTEIKRVRSSGNAGSILDLLSSGSKTDFIITESELVNFNHQITFSNINEYPENIIGIPSTKVKFHNLEIYKLSGDLYKYIKSVNKQQQVGENPFSEPVFIYSNVKNGLGIFAGYSVTSYK
jgi:Domain of unknown function (DUF4249)